MHYKTALQEASRLEPRVQDFVVPALGFVLFICFARVLSGAPPRPTAMRTFYLAMACCGMSGQSLNRS